MEAIEVLHAENVALMEVVISTTPLNDADKTKTMKDMEKIWENNFNEYRKRWTE